MTQEEITPEEQTSELEMALILGTLTAIQPEFCPALRRDGSGRYCFNRARASSVYEDGRIVPAARNVCDSGSCDESYQQCIFYHR
jgi:hypothetical protein